MNTQIKKTYTLGGLGCAHCAEKIQDGLSRLDDRARFTLNFSAGTLMVETNAPEALPELMQQAARLITGIEPGVQLSADTEQEPADRKPVPVFEIRLALAFILFIAAFFLSEDSPLQYLLFLSAYGTAGYDVLWKALRNLLKGRMLDEHFLMAIATLGALGIEEPAEAAAVMLFYQVGELFQSRAVQNSRRSIKSLLAMKVESVRLMQGGLEEHIRPEAVSAGATVAVLPGERFPLDGVLTLGNTTVDTSPLTGESLPREAGVGTEVLSGTINLTGRVEMQVLRPYSESAVARILHLVEEAAVRKAPTEQFITRFARIYTPAVVAAAAALAVIPPLVLGTGQWEAWLYRALIFLVVSCPCALVISIPLGFFGGIGAASKAGILVKGSNYLEALTQVEAVAFDKTGTLTEGRFTVHTLDPAPGYTQDSLLELAAAAESASTHPIARSIVAAWNRPLATENLAEVQEIHGQGLAASWEDKPLRVGRRSLLTDAGVPCPEGVDSGTLVYVAFDGRYIGRISLQDRLKPGTAEALDALRDSGVSTLALLTGDSRSTATAIAAEARIDTVYAELLPEGKVQAVEALMTGLKPGGKLVFVGDGINDAPVLARADIGIAMGGLGSDAAVEAADIVLMTDEPRKVAEAIRIARFTKKIVVQNILLAFAVKGLVLLLGAGGLATLWEAIFADVGVALLAILNAMRVLNRRDVQA